MFVSNITIIFLMMIYVNLRKVDSGVTNNFPGNEGKCLSSSIYKYIHITDLSILKTE